MRVKQINGLVAVAAVTMVALASSAAFGADAFPTRRAEFIVGFDAGGATDILARTLAKEMEKPFGYPITVINQAGGGGTVAAATVLRAKPDGYTFSIAGPTTMIIPPQTTNLPYAGPDTYQPIARVVDIPQVLVAPADSPYKTAADMVAAAKKERITVGVNQISSVANVNLSLLRRAASANLAAVPTGGDADSIRSLLGHQVAGAIFAPQAALGQVAAGKLKILGVFSKERVADIQGAPTFVELGYAVAEPSDLVIFGPKGMPEPIVNKLADLFQTAVKSPEYQKVTKEGGTIATFSGPKQLTEELKEKYAVYGKVLGDLGLLKK